MIAVDVLRDLACILEIDGIDVHADRERLQRLVENFGGGTADKGGIEAAGEKEAYRRVGVEPLFNAAHQAVVNVPADGIHIVVRVVLHIAHVAVADKAAILIIMAGREGHDPVADADQVLRLGGEHDHLVPVISVVERTDADRIAGGDVGVLSGVVEDEGELGVEHAEHGYADLLI